MIRVRSTTTGDWQTYRDLRLRALRDAPDAFGSTYEAEVTRTDNAWAKRIEAAATSAKDRVIFAMNGAEACGLIWCKLSASEPDVADIFQMWVAPASRGLGVGRALLEEALAWARSAGARRARLGVTASDGPAMRLYRTHGFCPVGRLEPLRTDSELLAQQMELAL